MCWGKRDISADTDLRLARYFGLSEGFFLGLQMDYDLMAERGVSQLVSVGLDDAVKILDQNVA